MERLSLSVRKLVEFTFHGEDISPDGSIGKMQEGTVSHKKRQERLDNNWLTELPIKLEYPVEDEELIIDLNGRMDAYFDGKLPAIEEIKLWHHDAVLTSPLPEHQAQVDCYGYILARTKGITRIRLIVSYVDKNGDVLQLFETDKTAQECAESFFALFLPWLKYIKAIRRHNRARNASLRDMVFPYKTYRQGQREMAVQVYTAIQRRRRLFAELPTGTGKTAAVVFPALKALSQGLTGQIWYLTARTTQRASAVDLLERMDASSLHLWVIVLDAKEKQCPECGICHPDMCQRAKGHYLRDHEVIDIFLNKRVWVMSDIDKEAENHLLCPFELKLSLCKTADLVIGDYNYALDPGVKIQRIFDRRDDITLLIDEAHHLPERIRDMLSGRIDSAAVRSLRTAVGKQTNRKHPFYRALTHLLNAMIDLPLDDGAEEGALKQLTQSLMKACQETVELIFEGKAPLFYGLDASPSQFKETIQNILRFYKSWNDFHCNYAYLWKNGKNRTLTSLALDIGSYFAETTNKIHGVICFSATMTPLQEMRSILGGNEEDACYSAPSPFPEDHLLVINLIFNTRYTHREQTAQMIAASIKVMYEAHPGKYIVFFPSFSYMGIVRKHLSIDHQYQRPGMTREEQVSFLAPYYMKNIPCLSLCVLGGLFSEGIDLTGDLLDGVAVIGAGLPQFCLEREALKQWYERQGLNGFEYAYRIPGMQKMIQAVGRVIRSENDVGIALLMDDRFEQQAYRKLMPSHWKIHHSGQVRQELIDFWNKMRLDK